MQHGDQGSRELRERRCPKNLYELTKSYFTQRIAALSTNSLRTEKASSRGCPQGSWNLQFNSLLELKFMARTKVVAYADDLLIVTRDSIRAVENYANVEVSKTDEWSRKI
jgi:hypothetical protein